MTAAPWAWAPPPPITTKQAEVRRKLNDWWATHVRRREPMHRVTALMWAVDKALGGSDNNEQGASDGND